MTDWRDRIVEVKRMRVRDILAHERNPRLHPAGQKDAVRGLLNEVGKADVLRAYTGADGKIKLWDGHLRQGLDPDQEWWVAITDLTEAEAAKMLVLFDPIAALAEQDTEKLEALLRDVNTGDAALQQMLADMAEDAGIVPPNTEAGKDTEPEINKADELRQKWQVEPGQMWQLGEHRLICGDCTDKATVERVMGGDRAQLIFTDPPYGVAIGAKNRLLNSVQPSGRNLTDIVDDALSPEELKVQLKPAFENMRQIVMADDCTVFVTAPQGGELGMIMMMMRDAKLPVRHVLIWKKNQPTFSLGRLDYDYQHEPILLTWGKRHKRPMRGEHRTSVWEIARPRASAEHPTMKPVELYENAMLNNSDPGDVTFDAYCGSGTMLIASENQGRRARATEISPGYVAVALERWSVHTGKTPALLD